MGEIRSQRMGVAPFDPALSPYFALAVESSCRPHVRLRRCWCHRVHECADHVDEVAGVREVGNVAGTVKDMVLCVRQRGGDLLQDDPEERRTLVAFGQQRSLWLCPRRS
jgi:hypothetical protein